jgi:hypothetical protein
MGEAGVTGAKHRSHGFMAHLYRQTRFPTPVTLAFILKSDYRRRRLLGVSVRKGAPDGTLHDPL